MQVTTSRFGTITMQAEDILLFPAGLIGLDELRHWVLLADNQNSGVGWLQSLTQPQLAMPVVSPRRYVPEYRVHLTPSELAPLQLGQHDTAYLLVILNKNEGRFTVNLKAPIIINLDRSVGCQAVTVDEQPVQFVLNNPPIRLRMSA